MGTHMVLLLSPVLASPSSSLTNPLSLNPRFSIRNNHRSRLTRYGGRDGESRWYSNPEKTVRSEHFNFNLEDEILTDDEDDGDEAFGFRSATKNKRIWWSDDSLFDDAKDGDGDGDEDEFGVLEGSIGGIAWISKVFKSFGWMVPAIVISLLLGTGPNAFFMALALPLAQSALSLVFDTLWSSPNDNPRSKPRTKRRPFARAASDAGMRKEQNTANEGSVKKGERNTPNFGGWDELDKQWRTAKVPLMAQTPRANERSQQKGKLSRRVRSRDKPLVLRLLIAIFPFLGSWTKLL